MSTGFQNTDSKEKSSVNSIQCWHMTTFIWMKKTGLKIFTHFTIAWTNDKVYSNQNRLNLKFVVVFNVKFFYPDILFRIIAIVCLAHYIYTTRDNLFRNYFKCQIE